ncbi:RNA polymerase III RPC4-domain-containing protein [Lophiotrema nucula]|uniref:RNA polymerase III RPC4-domain-containing protein n=1 Tax=Lophiotrema nucula TaxID=690887 RepID=A0A6A5YWN2_9PLEO|nr:RNA polymerase III RPC4-domain-containing protein [Lophiotrema nucula]
MPPKGRGGTTRGATRGRGRGRGGRGGAASAKAAAPSEDTEDTLPDAAASGTETAPAPPMESEVPEAGQDGSAGEGVTASIEPISIASSSISSPQTIVDSPAGTPAPRPSVQRLDTIKGAAGGSRSSPSTRGRAKKPAVKPTFTGRRSKEEREAREKLDKERERERKQERDKELAAKAKQNQGPRGSKRKDKPARGGAVSGPFSFGTATNDRKSTPRGTFSGSRASRVKHEDGDDEAGPSRRSGGGGGGSGGRGVKREEVGHVSSSDDDDDSAAISYPRQNVDDLHVIMLSDNEGGDQSGPREKSLGRMAGSLVPVRIARKEHSDRVVGLNKDASATTGQKQQAGDASAADVKVEGGEPATRKAKGKAKDVEITGVRKPYRGMWQEDTEAEVPVKQEQVSDDEVMDDLVEDITHLQPPGKGKQPESERRQKTRINKLDKGFDIQTKEDEEEWKRYNGLRESMRAELGPEVVPTQVVQGDTDMADAEGAPKRGTNPRDNNAYLFQFPPIVPGLLDPDSRIKQEPTAAKPAVSLVPAQKTPASNKEEGPPLVTAVHALKVSNGRVGKLRVHDSGRTTLEWANTSFELNVVDPAPFVQEIANIHTTDAKDRVTDEDGGDSISFARVKGKFVVVPNFEKMLS